ncbi:MAG: bifunctional adenosylcobinamide kinase/adenosylcobinamide-phosphate guanylyltransferase [Thermodesulfobacteriota bacterium]
MAKTTRFYVGGCRSGKSRLAEGWVASSASSPTYIATLQAGGDAEMEERIRMHRQSRGQGWHLVEEPLEVAEVLTANPHASDLILIDCLTLWLTNLLMARRTNEEVEAQVAKLCLAIRQSEVSLVLVANEVGLGIVPESGLARRFRDLAGWTNQQVAMVCDEVFFVAAGLPLTLKRP